MTLDGDAILRDGGIVALGACAIIAGLMRANPRLFLRHFPEPFRSQAAPLTPGERRAGAAGGLALVGWVLGGMILSTLGAEARGEGFAGLALHAFLVGMAFNLADWLVLDELWLGLLRGRGLLPAEVAAAAPPLDHAKHVRDLLKGTAIFAVLGLAVASGVAAA